VWRWQRRLMEGGVDGLLRDKTRKPGKAPEAVVSRLIARTRGKSQEETTHGTSRPMAGVERVCDEARLYPPWHDHVVLRPQQFSTARSSDSACFVLDFAERCADKTRMRQVAEALIALSRYPVASPPPMSPLTPLTMANLLKLTHVIPPPGLSLKSPNPPLSGAADFRMLADGCIDLIVGSGARIQ
jgi:hypothetical protein